MSQVLHNDNLCPYCHQEHSSILSCEAHKDILMASRKRHGDNRRRKIPPCFRCGRHLRGNHNKKLKNTVDGIERTFHKGCAFDEMTENPSAWDEVAV